MRILGIETSCDDSGVALIEAKGDFGRTFEYKVLGNALISQAKLHSGYGGVYPNLAKNEHQKNLVPALQAVLQAAGQLNVRPTRSTISITDILEREPLLSEQLIPFLEQHGRPDIDAIAVTVGPGLEPCLWVGINFARALSTIWNVPVVAVDHMEGHIVMSMMEIRSPSSRLAQFAFPALALLVSGGHTELVLMKKFGSYEIIGKTRDDAAGEAFDKVARLLDLPYPGGPEISRLAEEARQRKLPREFSLPRPMMHENSYEFSFSGLKTAVERHVQAHPFQSLDRERIAREVEDAITDVLVYKTLRAAEEYGVSSVIMSGGVSANKHIRETLSSKLEAIGSQLLVCPPEYSTDNGLMIALAGYFHALKKEFAELTVLTANGSLELA